MDGLVAFAQQVAQAIAILLPTALYASAIGWFVFGAWGLWQQSQPTNPYRGKPWIPGLSILLSGVCASFPTILTEINNSVGSSVTVSVTSDMTGYSDISSTSDIVGTTPGDTLVGIVTLFQGFFQVFGALCCFWALMSWRQSVNGKSNKSWGSCGVQMVFGIMLINVLTISEWLVDVFSTSS